MIIQLINLKNGLLLQINLKLKDENKQITQYVF